VAAGGAHVLMSIHSASKPDMHPTERKAL
jgi:hypothetical protein